MKNMKSVIIGLAVALAAVIGYTVYLHQGPIKNIATENQSLLTEIAQLKTVSQDKNSTYKAQLDSRTQQLKALETKTVALEKVIEGLSEEKVKAETELEKLVSKIRKEKESIEADLQSKVAGLENQLVQKQHELQTSHNETQQLKAALEKIKADHQSQLVDKIRLVEELQRQSGELEDTVSRTRKETETIEAELRGTIKRLENQLAQREGELSTSRSETQQLKVASDEATAAYTARLADKIRLVEDLQKKSVELEETVSRIKKETETLAADLQSTIAGLKSQLAQWDQELQASRKEVQTLRSTVAALEINNETLKQNLAETNRQLLTAGNQIKETRNDAENRLAESQRRFQALSDDIAAKDQKLAEIQADRQQLLTRVNKLDMEKGELARLKDALKNQLGMTQSQIEELAMETEAKEKQLKSKEQQLKSMEQAYQELSKQFEKQIREKEIKISNLENKLNIQLLDKILFPSGSADVSKAGFRVLRSLATEIKKLDGLEIAVTGHTDNVPLGSKIKTIYYDNLGLSVARAAAVSRTLRRMGVSPANLSAVGYSMHRPVTSNDTKEGRQQNRRVEIMLEPLR